MLSHYGSMDQVVEEYYNHVEAAIKHAALLPIRKRIGHINLIQKFSDLMPPIDESMVQRRLERLLPLLAAGGVGVDVNMAGQRVPTCGKPYVLDWIIAACKAQGIACVYGSDTHKPEHWSRLGLV